MALSFLRADLSVDLDTVERTARAAADAAMARPRAAARTTWQTQYDDAYARYLDRAEQEAGIELFKQARAISDSERAALPARERRILELREEAHLAPMIDCTAEAVARQEAAERELAKLTGARR